MHEEFPLLLRDEAIGLRAPERCDVKHYQALRNDLSSVGNLIGFARGLPLARIEDWVANTDNRVAINLTAVLIDDHRPVGHVHIGEVEPVGATCNLGLAVFLSEDRRRGYGGRILRLTLDYMRDWLRIRKATLRVLQDNEEAMGIYRKLGFEVEGTLRDHYFINGKYRSVVLMAKFLH